MGPQRGDNSVWVSKKFVENEFGGKEFTLSRTESQGPNQKGGYDKGNKTQNDMALDSALAPETVQVILEKVMERVVQEKIGQMMGKIRTKKKKSKEEFRGSELESGINWTKISALDFDSDKDLVDEIEEEGGGGVDHSNDMAQLKLRMEEPNQVTEAVQMETTEIPTRRSKRIL